MATGAGKSVIFQISALMKPSGFTVVISPLVSLMHDQVDGLNKKGIPAYVLNGETKASDATMIKNRMVDDSAEPWLLYVTPEKISKSGNFRSWLDKAYENGLIHNFAIFGRTTKNTAV
jgi:superfamily II DNA helicase RecQ